MSDLLERLKSSLADRYSIERELGRGGMATVYLAKDSKHRRHVAVKVLHPDLAAALGTDRFLREIEIAAQLQHPHILTLIDSGEADGFLYYVMPYVEGESLRTRLTREHELPLPDVLRILRDVVEALAEAHAHGVVHRDIKPDNVLLRGQHAIVTDFGVAKAVSEATGRQQLTSAGVALGTPAYMAPEQAAADPTTDHRADIYAVGVMAYEMLAGRPPFTGTTAQAVLSAHMIQAPEPVTQQREMPSPLAELVMKCLKKKPADRWQRADEILHQLEAMATPGTGTVPATSVQTTPVRRPWSKPRVAGVAAALAVVAALGYAVLSGRIAGNATVSPVPRLAVLPFENLGAADDEYFADGMTQELSSRLDKLSGLLVIARTSIIQYKKTTKAIPQIAQELRADYLIEGAVRWEKQPGGAGRVRITPTLVRAKDGTHVWSQTYEKPYGTGIFEMQSEIAERVAEALSVTLLAREQKAVRDTPTKNIQAYDAFLRGQDYSRRTMVGQDYEAQRLALESYQQAVKLDSGFALAHAWVAAANWRMLAGYDNSLPTGITSVKRSDLAKQAAEHALALDPDLPRAHIVLANYYRRAGNTTRSLEELDRALRADPSDPQSVADRGWALFVRGERDEGILGLKRAVALDPPNPGRLLDVARAALYTQNYQTAEAYYDTAITVAPKAPHSHLVKVWINLMQGRVERAKAAMAEGVRQVGAPKLLFQVSLSSPEFLPIFRILEEDYGPAVKALSWDMFGLDSVDYYLTKALAYRRDGITGRAYYDSLAIWAEPRVRRGGESDPGTHIAWVMGLAGSRKLDAKKEIRLLLDDKRYVWTTGPHSWMAEACVLAVLYDCAIDEIRLAMTEPQPRMSTQYAGAVWKLTPSILKLDPIWEPLRGRADFQKLVEQK